MTDALDKLIAAVEAFELPEAIFHGCLAVRGHWAYVTGLDAAQRKMVFLAHNGSVDAAQALHETLLPDWDVSTLTQSLGGGWHCRLTRVRGDNWTQYADCFAFDEDMARAWLLAVLRAYREQVKAE